MEKKQSSVNWLINCITEDQMVKSKSLNEWLEIFEKAKAMHREETKQFGMMCCFKTTQKNQWSLEGLYNETFL